MFLLRFGKVDFAKRLMNLYILYALYICTCICINMYVYILIYSLINLQNRKFFEFPIVFIRPVE